MQHQHHDRDGTQVEQADPPHDGADRGRDGLLGVAGFGGGDGDDLDAAERERDREQTGGDPGDSVGRESVAVTEQMGRPDRFGPGQQAEHQQYPDDEEPHDHRDLQCGEPEFELTEICDLREVDDGEEGDEHQRDDPLRHPPGIHEFTMLAAPVISTPSTMISMNQ